MGCCICRERAWQVLGFHHINKKGTRANVSDLCNNGWRVFFQEIAKCRSLLREEVFRMPIALNKLSGLRANAIANFMPVNIPRMISQAKAQFRTRRKLSDLTPRYVLQKVEYLIGRVSALPADVPDYVRSFLEDNRMMYRIVLRLHLSVKRIIEEYRLSRDMFDYIILSIEERFKSSRVHAGEMVGIIAAQSMGQPTTQLTLNTYVRFLIYLSHRVYIRKNWV